MLTKIFKIECLTNLQVGSGEQNTDIVDIQVEKDNGIPCIYSSSLKGALREYYENEKGVEETNKLFGSASDNQGNINDGKLKFLEAMLVSRPMRVSKGNSNYVNVADYDNLVRINSLYNSLCNKNLFNLSDKELKDGIIYGDNNFEIEGLKSETADKINGCFYANDFTYSLISLPIQARNNLGKNRNLWYEEYVPYGSVFYFGVIGEEEYLNRFVETFNDKCVQIGGNSSIGFGLCRISEKKD